jgi:putative MFS transporter
MNEPQSGAAVMPARLRWLPPRLRPPFPISVANERLLLLVGVAALIADYDVLLYGFAVEQIRLDLNIPESQVTMVVAIFRTGIIPALALAYLADIIGRRTLLMVTLAGAALATVLTSFATTMWEFIAAQTLARAFIYCEELLCVVVIAEEFSERNRGWAIGALGALAAQGAGLAALVFAAVDILPYGWRALYFLGAIPLLWLVWARRNLPETKRFKEAAAASSTLTSRWLRPLIALTTHYPLRLAILIATAGPLAFGLASAFVLMAKYLQTEHGWPPWMVSVLFIGGGAVAVLGNFISGLVSDRIGRKRVLAAAIVACLLSFWMFYGHSSGAIIGLFWILAIFSYFVVQAIISALGAELFPTSYRSMASGVRVMFGLFFGGLGLIAEGVLYKEFGNHADAVVTLLYFAPLALIPLAFLPEPASKTLESVAPDKFQTETAQ